LGKTNLSEWAYFMSSKAPSGYSTLGGQSNNPHGQALQVLGSSTGSAIATAARFSAASVGTETTGSIIAPASANGVAGMRPSLGLLSTDLIVPISADFDSPGPIARDVSSLALLLSIMSSPGNMGAPDNKDTRQFITEWQGENFTESLDQFPLSGLTIGIVNSADSNGGESKPVMLEAAAQALQAAGSIIVPARFSAKSLKLLRKHQIPSFLDAMATDVANYFLASAAPVRSLEEVINYNSEATEERAAYGQDLLIAARDNTSTPAEREERVELLRTTAYEAITSTAKDASIDAYLSLDNSMSLYYALAGVPAVTVPLGLDSDGQPRGATFVGTTRGSDSKVLGIAYAFEQATRWRVEPRLR